MFPIQSIASSSRLTLSRSFELTTTIRQLHNSNRVQWSLMSFFSRNSQFYDLASKDSFSTIQKSYQTPSITISTTNVYANPKANQAAFNTNTIPNPITKVTASYDHTTATSTITNVVRQVEAQKKAQAADFRGKMLARDQELLAKLLDREGGSAGVSIVNGSYEEGLGPQTKKNMFRLI